MLKAELNIPREKNNVPGARFVMSRAVRNAYREGKNDETLPPLVLFNHDVQPAGRLKKGDAVIFYNIRGGKRSRAHEKPDGCRIR